MEDYDIKNFMEINIKKTKVMLFNPKRCNIDFLPQIRLNGDLLDVVSELRLVGTILSDNLSWEKNTDSFIRRAYAKIWII